MTQDSETIREVMVAQASVQQRHSASPATGDAHESHPAPSYNPDAPSEEWGWHGSWRVFAPRGSSILLALGIFMLLMLNFTDHQSHVENFYFNGLALIGILWLFSRVRSGRRMRREAASRASADGHGRQ